MPVLDGDPFSAIDHVEIFNAHASREKVVHQDVLMLLFMGSLGGHHQNIENLGNEQEDKSSLGPLDENHDFEDTCAGKDEFMESETQTNPTLLKDITLDESSFENLEREDPISPLKDDIEDYFYIEKEK